MHLQESPSASLPNIAEDSLLKIDDLSISDRRGPDERLLVSGASLTVGRGETVAIVGESGSGKSLTALASLGLLPSNLRATGSISFQGTSMLGPSSRQLRALRGAGIALLMQDPGTMLNPLRRCLAHVEEGLAVHQPVLSRRARRAEALRRLEEVGIAADAALRYPFQVSGGMAQRVGLAAALAGDPELLIADEPTTALDVTTQREILNLLRDLRARRGMSLLIITHDLQVAFEVSDRVFVMYAGSVLEVASPGELLDSPLHPYTHALLQSEPSPRVRRRQLHVIPGSVPRASEVIGECSFASRCPWVQDKCRQGDPALVSVGTRQTACVRFDEVGIGLREELRHEAAEATPQRRPVRTEAPLLRIEGLVKQYGRGDKTNLVLDHVDLLVHEGEAVGLVGESGSGKSSLARCVMGLAQPTAGSIVLNSIDVSDYGALDRHQRRATRRAVQMVFQNPYSSLNPARSIDATLREALEVAGNSEDSKIRVGVGDLLEQVGLPAAYALKRPGALSGGERQRVAIARALALRPKVLVCDEPTSALDVSVQAQIINLLRDLQRDLGLGLLFITHDLAVVRQVADYLYVIQSGRFVEQGPTEKVMDQPTDKYTQLLLNSVAGTSSR